MAVSNRPTPPEYDQLLDASAADDSRQVYQASHGFSALDLVKYDKPGGVWVQTGPSQATHVVGEISPDSNGTDYFPVGAPGATLRIPLHGLEPGRVFLGRYLVTSSDTVRVLHKRNYDRERREGTPGGESVAWHGHVRDRAAKMQLAGSWF